MLAPVKVTGSPRWGRSDALIEAVGNTFAARGDALTRSRRNSWERRQGCSYDASLLRRTSECSARATGRRLGWGTRLRTAGQLSRPPSPFPRAETPRTPSRTTMMAALWVCMKSFSDLRGRSMRSPATR
jgi:hypothetical protein